MASLRKRREALGRGATTEAARAGLTRAIVNLRRKIVRLEKHRQVGQVGQVGVRVNATAAAVAATSAGAGRRTAEGDRERVAGVVPWSSCHAGNNGAGDADSVGSTSPPLEVAMLLCAPRDPQRHATVKEGEVTTPMATETWSSTSHAYASILRQNGFRPVGLDDEDETGGNGGNGGNSGSVPIEVGIVRGSISGDVPLDMTRDGAFRTALADTTGWATSAAELPPLDAVVSYFNMPHPALGYPKAQDGFCQFTQLLFYWRTLDLLRSTGLVNGNTALMPTSAVVHAQLVESAWLRNVSFVDRFGSIDLTMFQDARPVATTHKILHTSHADTPPGQRLTRRPLYTALTKPFVAARFDFRKSFHDRLELGVSRTTIRGGTLDAILVWLDIKLDRRRKGASTLLRHAAGQHCAFHLPPTPVTRGATIDLQTSMKTLGSNLEQCVKQG